MAVYAEADRYGMHVKTADEAHCLGPETVSGYLDAERLVTLAIATGCDALHPGYGFLSEAPELADTCARRGIRFIGPSAEVIRRMGDKTAARKAMTLAGIPITPGSQGNLRDLDHALEVAEELGYPVMLKATSGGGGRGIRRCADEKALRRHYERVISEASKAFGSAEVFMEKSIEHPRHIEVQILADCHGNAIHLNERDCSIQRRHQKLIEIAPSPQLTQQQRETIGESAVRAALAVGYESAGTVEFLLDGEGHFYFMEMNTRLQVEHPITEEITGIDIVKEQIRIAAGEPLRHAGRNLRPRGFAMEFRINAEDPQNDFLPSFGRITRYEAPGGPGIRTDGAIYTGYEIPPYYDSMCAKLIVWAPSWGELLPRAERALSDISVQGIKTTIPYYLQILHNEAFRRGCFDTGFVEKYPELTQYTRHRQPQALAAAIGAAIAAAMGR